ncbi:MAG TPA: DUF1801 domain-containing protein, partial [Dehalococcoidia bacterium]|nr:DUF1801 domain-containing protein [Dehalococcoidia bacterium]
QSPSEFLDALPPDRRAALEVVRKAILDNLPDGYQEIVDFGMLAYVIPLETYPKTYNGHPFMYAALASQKRHMAVYLMNIYGNTETEQWFTEAYRASGKRLDMGKSCVRFKSLDDLPVELVGQAIAKTSPAEYIQIYEDSRKRFKS